MKGHLTDMYTQFRSDLAKQLVARFVLLSGTSLIILLGIVLMFLILLLFQLPPRLRSDRLHCVRLPHPVLT